MLYLSLTLMAHAIIATRGQAGVICLKIHTHLIIHIATYTPALGHMQLIYSVMIMICVVVLFILVSYTSVDYIIR